MPSLSDAMAEEMKVKDNDAANPTTWKLVSGRMVDFYEITIPANDVERLTYSHKHNRRVQSEVKQKSIEDIMESMSRQQYLPCIGEKIDGAYYLPDGSRRRLAAIAVHVPLRIMYCETKLTGKEVKGLAKELQSALEHSYRDHGSYYEELMNDPDSPMTKEQIIEEENISEAHFDRCVRAWQVPSELVDLFEIPAKIPHEDFAKLLKVAKAYKTPELLAGFINELDIQPGTANKEVMAFIAEAADLNKKKQTDKPKKIVDVSKDKWVKARNTGSKQFYEISRASKEELALIEEFIVEVLSPKP